MRLPRRLEWPGGQMLESRRDRVAQAASIAVIALGAVWLWLAGQNALPPGGQGPLDAVAAGMDRVGADRLDARTSAVWAVREADVDSHDVWRVLADVDGWSAWMDGCVSARWTGEIQWQPGVEIDFETRSLLLPAVRARTLRVDAVDEGTSTVLVDDEAGVAYVWLLEPLDGGGTRVTAVRMSRGVLTGLSKPATYPLLRGRTENAVDALVREARQDE